MIKVVMNPNIIQIGGYDSLFILQTDQINVENILFSKFGFLLSISAILFMAIFIRQTLRTMKKLFIIFGELTRNLLILFWIVESLDDFG